MAYMKATLDEEQASFEIVFLPRMGGFQEYITDDGVVGCLIRW